MANSAKITGYTGTATEVTIPTSINGKLVRGIASNAFAGKGITRVTVDGYQGEIEGAPWGATEVTYLRPKTTGDTYLVLTRNRTSTSPDWARVSFVDGQAVSFDIKNYQFLNTRETTLASGDVMVRFSKFYYSRTVNGDIEKIVLADKNITAEAVTLHPAFSRYNANANAVVEVPYIYISKSFCTPNCDAVYEAEQAYDVGTILYHGIVGTRGTTLYRVETAITAAENTSWSAISSKVETSSNALVPMSKNDLRYSVTGYVNTMPNWRTAIQAKGNGWNQVDMKDVSMFQFLFIGKHASHRCVTEAQRQAPNVAQAGEGYTYEHGVAYGTDQRVYKNGVSYKPNTAITVAENTSWSAIASKMSPYESCLDDFGVCALYGQMTNIDGAATKGGKLQLCLDESKYADYTSYTELSGMTLLLNSNVGTYTTYDASYPWVMLPGGGSGGSLNAGLCSKNLVATSENQQVIAYSGYGNDETGLFSFCSNDNNMSLTGYYAPHQYYQSRLVYYPFAGNTEETITCATYKDLLGAKINGSDATGFKTYTGTTTTTYKYMNPTTKALVKQETITEPNTLRYWIHIPFNYDPSKQYNLITYLDGSGGVQLIQSNENAGASYNRLNLSYFDKDTAVVDEIKNSKHLQLLSAPGASGASHTGYINSVYKFVADDVDAGTMEQNHIGVCNGDAAFLNAWLTKVKANPEYDAFILVPQWNDEIWFENRAKYTIDGVDCVQLDIHNSWKYGYGEQISTKSYGHTYVVDQLSASPCQQLVIQLQDKLMKEYSIDPKKLTVLGFSLGGVGTYDFIAHNPTRFATALPCCAAGCDLSTELLTKLVGTKIRAYSGNSDGWVGGKEFNEALVARFVPLGGDATSIGFAGEHSCSGFSSDIDNIMDFIYNNARA